MKKIVLGVKIDDVSLDEASKIVTGWLDKPGKHYVVTTNPEFLMTAEHDSRFKKILNDADLSLPDGVGLKLHSDIVNTTPGIDLLEELIKLSIDLGYTIGLLGGERGVAEKTADCLRKKYPKIKIVYVDNGGVINEEGESVEGNESSSPLDKQSSPKERKALPTMDLLFVAFGHPKQEKWIAANLSKIPVKVAMGVGGSFDYLSGKVPRAPKWIRGFGLEWLYRLVIQPWRIKRQLALLKYLVLILSNGNNKNR